MDIIFDVDFYCKIANSSRQNRSKEQKELIKEMVIFCRDNLRGLTTEELIERIAICAKEEIIKLYPWNVKNEDAIAINIGFYSEAAVMAGLSFDFDTLFKKSFIYYIENIDILESKKMQIQNTIENDTNESDKPRFRNAFESEILGNLTRRYGSISNADADALEKECLYYATDMCLEFYDKSGGILPKDWSEHIFNEVCAVFDKYFSGKYNRAICEIQHNALIGSLDFAREKVQKYYNRP